MKVHKRTVVLVLVLLFGLIGLIPPITFAQQKSTRDNITDLLVMQEKAWNNGDLDKFMSGYLVSADTSYTSGGAIVWGYDALKERYQKKYGATRESMGKLAFSDLKIFALGAQNALCIGHWQLKYRDKATVQGVFSLTLVKTDCGWRIMHDHTSLAEAKT